MFFCLTLTTQKTLIIVLYFTKVSQNKHTNWQVIFWLRILFLLSFLVLGYTQHSYILAISIFILLYLTSFLEAPIIQYVLNQSINNEFRATLLSLEMTTRRVFSAIGVLLCFWQRHPCLSLIFSSSILV